MDPPAGFRYIDAHTHLHPPRLFAAIRRWFDEHTDWNLRGPSEPAAVAAALRAAGVERFVFFSYAHRPGMARELNRWLRDAGDRFPTGSRSARSTPPTTIRGRSSRRRAGGSAWPASSSTSRCSGSTRTIPGSTPCTSGWWRSSGCW